MEPTRIMYDEVQAHNSQKPLKFITDATISNRQMKWVTPENVSVSNTLRPKLTSNNKFDRQNTELFGTAPYRATGRATSLVDQESLLRNSTLNLVTTKYAETDFTRFDNLDIPLVVDSAMRPKSTRSDLRNSYAKK